MNLRKIVPKGYIVSGIGTTGSARKLIGLLLMQMLLKMKLLLMLLEHYLLILMLELF